MKLFERLFGKRKEEVTTTLISAEKPVEETEEWEEIPAYVGASPEDYERVSVIATAIAAGDAPEIRFIVKSILQRNPEVTEVALIAASVAAEYEPSSQFVVKSIRKKV